MRDCTQARRAYVEEGKSLRAIAVETGISDRTLRSRRRAEDWDAQRERFQSREGRDRVERLTGLVLDRIEQSLDGEEALPLKDLKAVTGALKELQELVAPEERQSAEPLTVRYADTLPTDAFEKAEKTLGETARCEEDVLSYIAFPQVAENFFDKRREQEEKIVKYSITEEKE